MNKIVRFALWGAVGFGIGGAIGGAITSGFDGGSEDFLKLILDSGILGIFGGASLGFVSKGWKGTIFLALAGGAGFFVGNVLSFFILFPIGYALPESIIEIYEFVIPLLIGAITGAIGGIAFRLALKDWRGVGLLALAGAVGFGIAWQINERLLVSLLTTRILSSVVPLSIWGLIGGAFLGAALGYLNKRRVD